MKLRQNTTSISQIPTKEQLAVRVKNMQTITASEIKLIQVRLILLAQSAAYASERQALLNNLPLPKKSKILSLNPCLDDNQLLRVHGRLAYALLPRSERFPIILPENSRFCELLLSCSHTLLMHAQHTLMTRLLRMKYYIPRIKVKVKMCINRCKPCTIFKQSTKNEIMAALPTERTEFTLPLQSRE